MCPQVRQWRALLVEEAQEQDAQSEAWVASHTQRCPSCRAKVQRSAGCNHMVCAVCGQHFCYVCGQDWCACHACQCSTVLGL